MTTSRFRGMLNELLQYDGETGNRSLTDWEVKFIDSIGFAATEGILTSRQESKLAEIWDQIFGDGTS